MDARNRTISLGLAPAVLWLAAFLAWPLMVTLRDAVGVSSAGLEAGRFFSSLRFTLSFSTLSVLAELALGCALGLALARPLPLAWAWRTCLLLPWAVPTVVSSKAFAWLFNFQFGLANLLLVKLGMDQGVNWFAQASTAWVALLSVEMWKTVPLVALLVLAGRKSLPDAPFEAAAMEGANAWQTFRHVTLPLLRPYLVVAGLFRLVDALRIFDSVWVLTGGGPGQATESLSMLAYKLYFHAGDPAASARVSLLTAVIVVGLAALIAWKGKFGEDLRERD